MMTSSSSIPTTTTTTNANASLLNYKCNNSSESNLNLNLNRRHSHSQPVCRPDSLSVAISTIPVCNLHSPQTPNAIDDDELLQYYPGTSAAATRTKSNAKINIGNYVNTKFNAFVDSITGVGAAAANKRHCFNGNNFGVIDANNMALSCTAADEEIAPLSPNRAERIIKNEQINHPTNMEYMEQRAELLKGISFDPTIHPLPTHIPLRLHESTEIFIFFILFLCINWPPLHLTFDFIYFPDFLPSFSRDCFSNCFSLSLYRTEHGSASSIRNAKGSTCKTTATLNVGEDDELTITGYERSILRTFLCFLCFIMSAGLLRLFMHWRRHWLLMATHKPCGLDVAKMILIKEYFEGKHTVHYVKQVITLNAETFA